MANPAGKEKLSGGHIARDKRRAKDAIAGLGESAGSMFQQLMSDINEGIRKGATKADKMLGDMAKKAIEDFKDVEFAATQVGQAGFKSLDFSDRLSAIEKERFQIMNGLTDLTKEEAQAKLDALEADEATYTVLQSKAELINLQNELLTSGVNIIGQMKDATIELVKQTKAFFSSWQGAAVGMIAVNRHLGKTSQELGVSVGQATMLQGQTALLGPAFKMAGLDIAATQKALIANFDTMDQVSIKNVASMGLLQLRTGLTADNAAKATKMFSLLEGSSAATAASMVEQVTYQSELAGAIPNKVITDITTNSEKIAEYWAGNVESMTQTAIRASKLGLSINDITTAAGKMLDINSSIAAEMEAEVLLGKNLNLEKAREAALMGDSATLMEELVKNAGSLEEFNSMNVIQRQKLAAALGMGVGELQKMIQEEKEINTVTGQITASMSKWGGFVMNLVPGLIAAAGSLAEIKAGGGIKALAGLGGGKAATAAGPLTKSGMPDMRYAANKNVGGAANMAKTGKGIGGAATGMLKGAAAMLIMGAALWVAAKGFDALSKVEWGELWPGAVIALIALAGAMALFGIGPVAVLLLTGAAVFAAMSIGLMLFGVALMAVGKGVELTRNGLTGFASIIGELIPMAPGMLALGAAFGIMGIGLMSLSGGLIALVPALPIIMALGAMATLALAMGGAGGGAENEVMEMKSSSIEDKLDALTAAILAQPIVIEMDGKRLSRGLGMAKTQNTIDVA